MFVSFFLRHSNDDHVVGIQEKNSMALRTTHQRLLVFAAGGGCCGCSCWRFVATLCSRTSLSSSSGGACCHAGVRRISSMMELLSTSFQPFLMSSQSGTSFRFPAQRDRFGVCRPLGGGFSLHSLSKDSSFCVSSLALKLKPKTGRRGVLELSRAVSVAAAVTARSPETDLFLADPSITWKSLGLSQELTKALLQIDLQQPSLIQVMLFSCLCNPHFKSFLCTNCKDSAVVFNVADSILRLLGL